MKFGKPILALAALLAAGSAHAVDAPKHNYPTQARVEFVYDCMRELGGENYTTLYKCSCAIDEIANQVTYDRFVAMDTFTRGRQAGGERPEILREGPAALQARSAFAKVKRTAADRCIIESPAFIPETRGGDDDDDDGGDDD